MLYFLSYFNGNSKPFDEEEDAVAYAGDPANVQVVSVTYDDQGDVAADMTPLLEYKTQINEKVETV